MTPNFEKFLIENGNFTAEQFQELRPHLNLLSVDKGTVIGEGSNAQAMYFVESGLLRFYTIDIMGKERVLQFAPENWFIADRSNILKPNENIPNFAYHIDAIEDSKIIDLSNDMFCQISNIEPSFARVNETLLQNHIMHLQHRINLLIGSDVRERYEDFIRLYPNVFQRVPQWMVASYLGVTPEGLSRVRNQIARGK